MSKSSKSTKTSSSTNKSISKGSTKSFNSKSTKSLLSTTSNTISTLSTQTTRSTTDKTQNSSEDEEELIETYLQSEKESLGQPSLISFGKYLDKYVQPYKRDYSDFATSYLLNTIPIYNLDNIHSGRYEPEPLPLKNPVIIKEYADKEMSKTFLGESIIKPMLIPSSRVIWKEIQNTKFKTAEDRRTFLYFKARQWCEVSKALALDSKYPQRSPVVFREKFSNEHQKSTVIVKALKKKNERGGEQREIASETEQTPFTIPLELLDPENPMKDMPEYRVMAQHVQEEKEAHGKLNEELSTIFRDIQPIQDSSSAEEEPWQFKALKVSLTKPKKIKRPPFKRTEYPPKTKREKILELRKLLPGPKPLHLEEDMLSGIWEPELMIDEFQISPIKKQPLSPSLDKPIIETESTGDTKDDTDINVIAERLKEWEKLHFTKEKCKNWLSNIPD